GSRGDELGGGRLPHLCHVRLEGGDLEELADPPRLIRPPDLPSFSSAGYHPRTPVEHPPCRRPRSRRSSNSPNSNPGSTPTSSRNCPRRAAAAPATASRSTPAGSATPAGASRRCPSGPTARTSRPAQTTG